MENQEKKEPIIKIEIKFQHIVVVPDEVFEELKEPDSKPFYHRN